MYFVQILKVQQRITLVHGGKLYKPLKYILCFIMATQNCSFCIPLGSELSCTSSNFSKTLFVPWLKLIQIGNNVED